jgi:hypothetical protein
MANLSPKKEDFLQGLLSDRSLRRWGFEKLLSQPDPLEFLPRMQELGFFSPSENPAPESTEQEGYIRVPRWEVLPYLEKVSQLVSERGDVELAASIVQILRDVTRTANASIELVDNYVTWYSFSEILAALPTSAYGTEDVRMLSIWLSSRFDSGTLVGTVIGEKLLPKLLSSKNDLDKEKALLAVACATSLRWPDGKSSGGVTVDAFTAVDGYWLRELFVKNAAMLGKEIGKQTCALLSQRIGELSKRREKNGMSWIWRPAIEDHPQNLDTRNADYNLVSALRDILLAYVDADANGGRAFAEELMGDDLDIRKRIAIHAFDERFELLKPVFQVQRALIFQQSLHHEVFRFLKNHFGGLDTTLQQEILDLIASIGNYETTKNADEEWIQRQKHRWLLAIKGQGNTLADQLFASLAAVIAEGNAESHPEFLSYHTSWSGFGTSPQPVAALLAMDMTSLVKTLNSFEPQSRWQMGNEPTVRGLSDALAEAVKLEPVRYSESLSIFLQAKPPYQYAVLSAFLSLHSEPVKTSEKTRIDWALLWPKLIAFAKELLTAPDLLQEGAEHLPLTPNKEWLAPAIAELIRSGARSSENPIPGPQIQLALDVVASLLRKISSESKGSEIDAMSSAINTPRGKAIEALFELANRICQDADRSKGEHSAAWSNIAHLFDAELELCVDGNFEFSTHCGFYLANLRYLSGSWLRANLERIFPRQLEWRRNWNCAVQGYAYMPQPDGEMYRLLRDQEVFQLILERNPKGRYVRQKTLQLVAVALLWGEEALNEGILGQVLARFDQTDVHEMIRFFWGIRGEALSEIHVQRILDFWRNCMSRVSPDVKVHREIMSDLGLLTTYLKTISTEELSWLLQVARYIGVNHNTDFFLESLELLIEGNPKEIGEVVREVVRNQKLEFDFRQQLERIIRKLADRGQVVIAKQICNSDGVKDIPAIVELYLQLKLMS